MTADMDRPHPLAPRPRVVAAARELFLTWGYLDTTIGTIAREAGVALRTIYTGFGSKVGVLAAVQDEAVAGDDNPVPLLERPWARQLEEMAPPEALHHVVHHFTAATERVAQIHEVIAAAASDTGVRELLDLLHNQRVETCRAVATRLLGHADRGRRMADAMYVVLGVETYGLLVTRRGWTREQWATWAEQCLSLELQVPSRPEIRHGGS